MGTLCRQGENDGAVSQVHAGAHIRLAERLLATHRPQAEGNDVNAVGRRSEQLDEVLARALRVGDHPIRAANGQRHQQPHPPLPNP